MNKTKVIDFCHITIWNCC